MTSLADRALLVSLNMSQWSARKLDKRETLDVAAKHGIRNDVARVNKSLLPGAASLADLQKLTGEVRTYFLANTLPWGPVARICKAVGYMAFAKRLGDYKSQWEGVADHFMQDYPALKAAAPQRLGGMYSDADYPSVYELRRRFRFEVAFMPVGDDFRVSLGDDAIKDLREQLTAQISANTEEAMREAWSRIHDVVAKAHERLSGPENVFRDSLVENAQELVSILPSLNLTDDPHLEAMRVRLQGSLCAHTPGQLRVQPHKREAVVDEMADMMAKMEEMYGAR